MDAPLPGDLLSSLFAAYVGGFFTSLTPCVYPLIPVTLAIFGANRDASRLASFLLSCAYVFGIALTYTTLGVISAISGSVFGQFLGNPWVVVLLALFLVALAVYSLDLIKIDFLSRLQGRASQVGGNGMLGAFFMGTVSGVVAAPCAAPLLIAILGVAAGSKDMLRGGLLLFVYSLGFGTLFIVLGTFSNLIQRLPRSGNWLYLVKFVIASSLLLAVAFLIEPLLHHADWWRHTEKVFGSASLMWAVAALALLAGFYASARQAGASKLGCSALLAVALYGAVLYQAPGSSNLNWKNSVEAALEQAKASGSLVMVDFYADWCAACKEFEKITFPDSAVAVELNKIALARIDMTKLDEKSEEYEDRYEILGLPTILFLRADGSEINGSRIEGFLNPQEFLAHLEKVRSLLLQ